MRARTPWFAGILLLGAFAASGRASAACVNYALHPRTIRTLNSPGRAIDRAGDFLCVVDAYGGFRIWSIASPADPALVAELSTPGAKYDVAVHASFAYVAGDSGLEIVNLALPSPEVTGRLPGGSMCQGVAVTWPYVYLARGYPSALLIVDVSDPSAPTLVGSLALPGSAVKVFLSGNYAYVALTGGGLGIVDVSSPAAPTLLSQVPPMKYEIYGVTVSGGIAYTGEWQGSLGVLDVSNPAAPTRITTKSPPRMPLQAVIDGGYLFVAGGPYGLEILNLANPRNPVRIGYSEAEGETEDVVVAGDFAYLATLDDVAVVQLGDRTTPSMVSTLNVNGQCQGVAVRGAYAYLAADDYGLHIISISSPAAPVLRRTVNTPGRAFGVAFVGNYAYVADGAGGLQIIDITNPLTATIVGQLSFSGGPQYVATEGTRIYLTAGHTLWVLDASSPASPVIMGSLNTGTGQDIIPAGSLCYVAGPPGVFVVDVSDGSNPTLVTTCNLGLPYSSRLALAAPYLYVVDTYRGLKILDVSNPASPVVLGGLFDSPGERSNAVIAHGQFVYIGENEAGLQVLSVTNPAAPMLMGGIESFVITKGLATDGQYVYLAGYDYTTGFTEGRFRVAPIQCPAVAAVDPGGPSLRPVLLAPFPNPTRSRSAFGIDLPQDSRLEIAVYDVSGRRIRLVADGAVSAGYREWVWDGLDDTGQPVQSGVYYLRVISGGQVRAAPITLIR
jgi:hypothetical protein